MEFRDVLSRRRMVRHYLDEHVPLEVLERILASVRRAPSAGFSQGQRLVVVTEPARRRAIADLLGETGSVAEGFEPWLSTAPVHVVVCTREADYHERYTKDDKLVEGREIEWPVPFWFVDAGAAMMALLMAAIDEGFASGFLGVPVEKQRDFRRLLELPDDVAVVGIATLGRAAPGPLVGAPRRAGRPSLAAAAVSSSTGSAGMGVEPAEFVRRLAAARIGRTFNQYRRCAVRRQFLCAYLNHRRAAPILLVGEAAGYRGARLSGLPFTSQRQLTGSGPSEATATVVHRVLAELGIEDGVLLWNVVPTHPHRPGDPQSNRRPTRAEVDASLPFLEALAAGRRVVAVGRLAAAVLEAPYVRHPSHGGAQEFRTGLVEFLARG